LVTSKCFCSDSSWCSSIHSSILLISIWSFLFSIKNFFNLSLRICKIVFSSCLLIDSDSSLLILSILWLNDFFVFIWLLRLLSASALSFSFSKIYSILILYCFNFLDHRTCLLLSSFVVMKCNKFLWSIRIVSSDASSIYTLYALRTATIASSFLSWMS
jgi:hypothetical protein